MTSELASSADVVRKLLPLTRDSYKVILPVYFVFSKMDSLAGFAEYFGDLDEETRKSVWGITFKQDSHKIHDAVLKEVDLITEQLSKRLADRLIEVDELRARSRLYGFPTRFCLAVKKAADYVKEIVDDTETNVLRGIYFISGAQDDKMYDALLGAAINNREYFLNQAVNQKNSSVYFLADLFAEMNGEKLGDNADNDIRYSWYRIIALALIAIITVGMLTAWWVSYEKNESLIEETESGVADHLAAAGPLIKQTFVTDPSLLPIYELVGGLRLLPEGYARRNDSTPLGQTFGLSQRSRLQDVSVDLYQDALERLMRPRLILSLEQQIQKNIDNPAFVYEALKVYLMLGAKAPETDKALVLSWFTRDWEERAFPGAPYAEGRKLLRDHLQAMLDMDRGAAHKVSLNGPLVEQAQATLARVPAGERAYALLKSEAHNDDVPDWLAESHGGPDMALVYEASNGAGLDTVRVRGFYTHEGFLTSLLGRMQTIADKLQKENWVLGASGDQAAVKQPYVSLFPGIIELYSKDFIAEWTAALNNLQLKPLIAGKPKYVALAAASAPTSPIRALYESVRDETALTRERPKSAKETAQTASHEAIGLAIKSQRKVGEPPPEAPGATVDNYFKADAILVDGVLGSRPIDALIANLNDLYQQLVLAAVNPAQAKQALEQVEVQVASLRANASRLPQPLSGQLDKVATDAAGQSAVSNLAQIADDMAQNVTGACQQIVSNRYPFAKSDRDVPMAEFAKLFSPNGVIDRFFAANLDPLVNHTGKPWVWKPNPVRKLSETTLRQFQQASEIRDALFPAGGATPAVAFDVRPLTLSSDAQTATLSINGTNVVAQQGTPFAPATVPWPGGGAGGASIVMAPDMPDRNSSLERTGAWALFRLIDAGSSIQSGNALKVSFVVFGREVSYQFTSSSLNNPLSLTALRQFKCPNGL